MPVFLAPWEAKIGRIVVRGQHRQIVLKTPSPKKKKTQQKGLEV
jgi:hypothetical protein